MIKNLEQPYVFAQLDQFQELFYVEAQKSVIEKELQGLNVDSFCNAVRAIMSNAYLYKPIIDIHFSLGMVLKGWIPITAQFGSNGGD